MASTEQTQNNQPQNDFSESVERFAERNGNYYVKQFNRIQRARVLSFSFNLMAAIFGPLWAAARGLWGFFWGFLILEVLALVQIGRGWWGELGADKIARAERLQSKSEEMFEKARVAAESGATNIEALQRNAENLEKAANKAMAAADAAAAGAETLLLTGIILLVVVKLAEGFLANSSYEKQYTRWRSDKTVESGFKTPNLLFGAFLTLVIFPLTLYRFTVSKPAEYLVTFPSNKEIYNTTATWLEEKFDQVAISGANVFDGITDAIRTLLDGLEVILVGTPWPVVMLVIVVLAWRLAGPRVAIFTIAALAYLAMLGFWEKSMATVALLGAAAVICIVIGIPLGVWFSRSQTAYAVARPVLDFMQTMPAFVYLIPVIAFFWYRQTAGYPRDDYFRYATSGEINRTRLAPSTGRYQRSRNCIRLY